MTESGKKARRPGIVIMARLISLVGSLAWFLVLAVVTGVLGFLCAMGVTTFGAMGIAKVLGENITLSYGLIMVLTVGCGVLRGGLRYVEQYNNHYIAFTLLAALRDRIFRQLRVLCPAKLESREKGAIIAMLTADVETLEVFYAHTITPICIAIITSAVVLVFIGVFSSWWLSLVTLCAYVIIGVVIPLIASRVQRPVGVAYRKEFSDFNAFFLDSVKGVREIVLHNGADERGREVDRRSKVLQEETRKNKHASETSSHITDLCVSICILIALVVGVLLCLSDTLSVGCMLVGIVAAFSSFGPVIALAALPGNLTQTLASGDRVLDLLEEEPAVEPVKDGKDFDFQSLDVKDVNFAYGEQPVLRDATLSADQGEIVGIVGPSGCGKSTLLKLLLRFWDKDGGEILYNGTDISQINSDSLLDNVTMVSQSTYLFDDTIEENLRMAKPDATEEELTEACRKASVHEFICSLPEGYQTRVGTLGDNLSAGERQRIGLARAFLHDSPVILMDEPTSNVDSMNEGIILRAVSEQKADRCIILVSHRASTMAIADRVYTIEDGVVSRQR